MICINPYHKLIYTLFGKFEYEQWKDQSNLEHSHPVSKQIQFYHLKSYFIIYTIQFYNTPIIPNSIFFRVYLNILFFYYFTFSSFSSLSPSASSTSHKKIKIKNHSNHTTTMPPTNTLPPAHIPAPPSEPSKIHADRHVVTTNPTQLRYKL